MEKTVSEAIIRLLIGNPRAGGRSIVVSLKKLLRPPPPPPYVITTDVGYMPDDAVRIPLI